MKIETKIIHNLDSADYKKALEIRKQAFVVELNIPLEIEVDQYENSAEHFITLVDGEYAATGRMRVKDQYIKFERIATHKDFRGKGVGKHLMQTMLQHALENHPQLLPFMNSQMEAVPFYEKLGWESRGEIFYDVGIAHKIMVFESKIK